MLILRKIEAAHLEGEPEPVILSGREHSAHAVSGGAGTIDIAGAEGDAAIELQRFERELLRESETRRLVAGQTVFRLLADVNTGCVNKADRRFEFRLIQQGGCPRVSRRYIACR